jgi:ribonuclease/clavin/mitogillin
MQGMKAPDVERWSERVLVVRGLNPGPFTGPGTNTYLVGTGRRPLLIDTGAGVAGYLDLLGRALDEECGAREPGEIAVTHAHGDHLGGAAGVGERFGPRSVHKRPWPERDTAFRVEIAALDDGARLETDGARLRAVHCPGHAQDHLCFLLEEERALFTGDVVLGAGTTVIPLDGGSMAAYLESLRRILELDLERIYPGHGPCIEDPAERVRAYLAHRHEREEQIVDALAAGATSVEEIVERIYTDTPRPLHRAAGQSVLSHLLKLEHEHRAARADPARWRLC